MQPQKKISLCSSTGRVTKVPLNSDMKCFDLFNFVSKQPNDLVIFYSPSLGFIHPSTDLKTLNPDSKIFYINLNSSGLSQNSMIMKQQREIQSILDEYRSFMHVNNNNDEKINVCYQYSTTVANQRFNEKPPNFYNQVQLLVDINKWDRNSCAAALLMHNYDADSAAYYLSDHNGNCPINDEKIRTLNGQHKISTDLDSEYKLPGTAGNMVRKTHNFRLRRPIQFEGNPRDELRRKTPPQTKKVLSKTDFAPYRPPPKPKNELIQVPSNRRQQNSIELEKLKYILIKIRMINDDAQMNLLKLTYSLFPYMDRINFENELNDLIEAILKYESIQRHITKSPDDDSLQMEMTLVFSTIEEKFKKYLTLFFRSFDNIMNIDLQRDIRLFLNNISSNYDYFSDAAALLYRLSDIFLFK